jgi:dephospho-CoA kinase
MIVVGLTGSIGMGKSTAAGILRRLGVPVFDADGAVHRLLAPGGPAVTGVGKIFPASLAGDRIDRGTLGDIVFSDVAALRRLEAILHPLVRRAERNFLAAAARAGRPIVVLDVPLLYETGGDARVDSVIVVSAPRFVQQWRVLARPGMTAEKFRAILARQTPDGEKRRRADYVVSSAGHRGDAFRQLRRIVGDIDARRLRGWRSRRWPPRPIGGQIGWRTSGRVRPA